MSWHTVEPINLDLSKYGTPDPQLYRVWRGRPYTRSEWNSLDWLDRMYKEQDIFDEWLTELYESGRKQALEKKVIREEALQAGDKVELVNLARRHGLKESDIAAQLFIHDSLERKQHDQD